MVIVAGLATERSTRLGVRYSEFEVSGTPACRSSTRLRRRSPLLEGRRRFSQLDGNAIRLMVDAIGDVLADGFVTAMAVHEENPTKAVSQQALGCFEIQALNRLGRKRDGAWKPHVVGRASRKQDGRNEDIGFLRYELRLSNHVVEIGAYGPVQAVLLQRWHRDDDHVRPREQVLYLRPRHVWEVVLDLLLMPEGVGLRGGGASVSEQDRENCDERGAHTNGWHRSSIERIVRILGF
jgi:hypothetical protein